jgi:hypothetical protein
MTSTGGEVAPVRAKGGDDANWDDVNLSGQKMKKMHAVDSVSTNGQRRFKTKMSQFNFFKTHASEI